MSDGNRERAKDSLEMSASSVFHTGRKRELLVPPGKLALYKKNNTLRDSPASKRSNEGSLKMVVTMNQALQRHPTINVQSWIKPDAEDEES